eukprot:TRINITY_DN17082_c0_g1_i3.p1 TRINITY_DN17082_c0_g1~~TRINITY_DN17082_c0_g1_i3.p1  ORF type:complete len:328 (+),score=18.69 TRINITY_DN17082_c0_g1_i3:64-1047(+)
MSRFPHSFFEPYTACSVLDGLHIQMLSAVDIARTMLCTCQAMRSRVQTKDDTSALLQMMRIGSLTALEVCATFGPEFLNAPDFALSKALSWLHGFERSILYEDFVDQQLIGLRHRVALTPGRLQWRRYGNIHEHEVRCIEPVQSKSIAKCMSLRLGRSLNNIRRGVTSFFAQPMRPDAFDTLLRFRLDPDRPEQYSYIGCIILSDGAPLSPTSQGQFGSEAVNIYCCVKPNHEATLYAVGGGEKHALCKASIDVWMRLSIRFDWKEQQVSVLVSEAGGKNLTPDGQAMLLPFSGTCRWLQQMSLLSLEDSGHATTSWTSLRFRSLSP